MPFDGSQSNPDTAIVDNMMAQLATADRWVKRVQEDGAGRRCLYGALFYARYGCAYGHGGPVPDRVHCAMNAEARARGFGPGRFGQYAAVRFNNADETTHADILDFLGCVRRRLEQEVSHAV